MFSLFFPFDGRCSQIAWSPNGKYLAIQNADNRSFFLYNLERKMRQPWMLFARKPGTELPETVRCLAWSPQGKYLALAGNMAGDDVVTIVNPKTGALITTITPDQNVTPIQALAWSPTGKLALTTYYGPRVFLYDVASLPQEPRELSWGDETHAEWVHGWLGPTRSVAVASHSRSLLTIATHADGKVQAVPEERFRIEPQACAVSPSGRFVALAAPCADVSLYRFKQAESSLQKTRIYQPDPPYLSDHTLNDCYQPSIIAWSRDGKYLATSFSSLLTRIYIWNATTGCTHHVLETSHGTVTSLAWGPEHRLCWGELGCFQISQFLE